ncbi:MAG: hypothetical protein IPL32_14740 [Chloracidobacterium sp.]|nr:hypothetical protein [Chloracidobacterium sp.]
MNDALKPYELRFDSRRHYLHAHIHAKEMTRATALSYLQEVANECDRGNYRRLLLERDVPMMLNSLDLFQTTNDFLDMVKYVRVAVLNQYKDQQTAMNFALLISANRKARYNVFTDRGEAEKWLLEGVRIYEREPPPPIFVRQNNGPT